MLYKDKVTGAVLNSDSVLGGDWVPVEGAPSAAGVELSVTDIKAKLDELGIEYDKKARKSDLLALLAEHGG